VTGSCLSAYSEVALKRQLTLVTFARLLFSAILAARDALGFPGFEFWCPLLFPASSVIRRP
jgi:hypothetical protein